MRVFVHGLLGLLNVLQLVNHLSFHLYHTTETPMSCRTNVFHILYWKIKQKLVPFCSECKETDSLKTRSLCVTSCPSWALISATACETENTDGPWELRTASEKGCRTYVLGSLRLVERGERGDVCVVGVFDNVVVDVGSAYRSLNKAVGVARFQIPGGEKSQGLLFLLDRFSYLDWSITCIYSAHMGYGSDYCIIRVCPHSSSSLACLSRSSAWSSALWTRSLSANERRSDFSASFRLAPSIAAWYSLTFCRSDSEKKMYICYSECVQRHSTSKLIKSKICNSN